jgi:inositol polyphosphate 1-phosphatase
VARGVGNKILSVIEGNAFGYFLTKPSSYKWDTCAPHAILESVGGTLTDSKGDPIYYNLHDPDDKKKSWCNSRGLIVIRNTENMFKMGLLSSL